MVKIFVSYRRGDSAMATGRVTDRLVQAFGKDRLFQDIDNIPLGTDFRQVLRDAVSQCEVMLVIIGPKWVTIADSTAQRRLDNPGDFVRLEVEAALERGIPVIPVLVESAPMPAERDLPQSLGPLAYRHGMDVRSDMHFHSDVTQLIDRLTKILATSSAGRQSGETEISSYSPGLAYHQYPEIVRTADAIAIRSQRWYYRLLRIELVMLVLAAVLVIIGQTFGPILNSWLAARISGLPFLDNNVAQTQRGLSVAYDVLPVALMLIVGGCLVTRYLRHPDVQWQRARALAEGAVSLGWRYAMRAVPSELPYGGPPLNSSGEEAYATALEQLLDDVGGGEIARPVSGPLQVTPRMSELRNSADLEGLRDIYIRGRILDQQAWYARKAQQYRVWRNQLRATIAIAYVAAAMALPFHGLTAFTTMAAALGVWLAARRYEDFAQSYPRIARKLAILSETGRALSLAGTDGEARLQRFVDEVEILFESEHGLSLARGPYSAH